MCDGCRPARPLIRIAIAFAGAGVDVDAVEDDLCALAACALAGQCARPADQLTTVAAAMEPFALSDDQLGFDDLLVHRVLERWAGAPLVLCALAAEAAARAGLDLVVAGDGRRHLLVHRDAADLAWDPAFGVRAIGDEERSELRVRCGHQVAFAALAQIVERATRQGDLTVALHATELRLRLPLAPPLRARVEAEKAGLLASLN